MIDRMCKFIVGFIFCLISVTQTTASADSYEPWPNEIPIPSVYFADMVSYSKFDKKLIISPQSGTASILKQYQVGILVKDLTGYESSREINSTFSESSNCFSVVVNDLFPETKYEFTPYIVVNGIKCIASNGLVTIMPPLMRDQNGQWGDYSHTQTTINIKGLSGNKHLQIWDGSEYVDVPKNGYIIENLEPRPWYGSSFGENEGIERKFRLFIGERSKIYDEVLYTAHIKLDLFCVASPTGLLLKPKCNPGDADIQGLKLVSNTEKKEFESDSEDSIWYGGLNPNEKYDFQYYAIVKSKDTGIEYLYPMRQYSKGSYKQNITFATTSIIFGEVDIVGVSSSATIASVNTNIDDQETNVGFMWKKYDAPASLKPTERFAAIHEGVLEGKIRNLQTQSYYNIRPFYKSKSGQYFYGDWVTFDPSDYSYIDPTVKILTPENIGATNAVLKGYILEGSDNIIEQGFEYEPDNTTPQSQSYRVQAKAKFLRITSTGQIMTATIDGLRPNTIYNYRAFAITSKGEFYSDNNTFKTDAFSGIHEIDIDETSPLIVGYYSIQGHRFEHPQKGLNIVIYSDGTAKKMIFE